MNRNRLKIKFIHFNFIFIALIFFNGGLYALNPGHGECMDCHNLHLAPGQALTYESGGINVLCLSCHGEGAVGSVLEADVHSGTKYGAFEMGCADCHNSHNNIDNYLGGINIKQVGHRSGEAVIWTPNSGSRNVAFESRGDFPGVDQPTLNSFADGDEGGTGYDGACEVCHTQTSHHRNDNSGGDHTHYVGDTCTRCHTHLGNFAPAGGGTCSGCHSTIWDKFASPNEGHHVMGSSVTEEDCGVCHSEPGLNHMDGDLDLRDPDTGSIISFPKGITRDRASSTLETDVTNLQNFFCLKCHDSDGAPATKNTTGGGTDLSPFSSSGTVADVDTQLNVTNNYHHAVKGTVGNTYCNSTTMEAPWDTGGPHTISCFDCHDLSGHGAPNQRMLRTPVDVDALATGTLTTTLGDQIEVYCTECHKYDEYGTTGTAGGNSKFEYHGSNQNQHGSGGGNDMGCMGCHGGIRDESGISGNGSAAGNIHGGGYSWGSNSWSIGSATQFFMVGGWNSGWELNTSAGKSGCGGGTCNHPGRVSKLTPGKEYTN